jgi:hypothetical protein
VSDPLISDEELVEMSEVATMATPGPWHVRYLNDSDYMTLVAVSTEVDAENHSSNYPDFDSRTIIAATLVQRPDYAGVSDDRWGENAYFIAKSRTDVPRLVAEVQRLRKALEENQ